MSRVGDLMVPLLCEMSAVISTGWFRSVSLYDFYRL